MNKILIIVILILGISFTSQAQTLSRQVISSGGGYLEAGNYKLSFTIGEPIVGYVESGTFKLTQGFQQGSTDVNTAVKDIEILVDYSLYPNPTTNQVNLNLKAKEKIDISLSIIDISGKIVVQGKQVNGTTIYETFDVSSFSSGNYFVVIATQNKKVQSIPFIKQ